MATRTLSEWCAAIRESTRQADNERKEWQERIGDPKCVYEIGDYVFGFWEMKDAVLVANIDKRGPNPATQRVFTMGYIENLVKTLE